MLRVGRPRASSAGNDSRSTMARRAERKHEHQVNALRIENLLDGWNGLLDQIGEALYGSHHGNRGMRPVGVSREMSRKEISSVSPSFGSCGNWAPQLVNIPTVDSAMSRRSGVNFGGSKIGLFLNVRPVSSSNSLEKLYGIFHPSLNIPSLLEINPCRERRARQQPSWNRFRFLLRFHSPIPP